MDSGSSHTRSGFFVKGTVQGVGFRPFVYRLACELELGGWIKNTPEGVAIEIEGNSEAIEEFRKRLQEELPPAAFVSSLEESVISPCGGSVFSITTSDRAGGGEGASVPVLTDLALCPECLREMNDPENRRYRYPFITCTNCGPRYTIMTGLPYDRPQTTMKDFPLCPQCAEEYDNPLDRRFHAQPLACPECGPHLYLSGHDGNIISVRDQALEEAAGAVRSGKILALKGLGGFHIICDALDGGAVRKLRERKYRPTRPFAVMMPDMEAARKYCKISVREEELLTSSQAPIVILDKRGRMGPEPELADGIAPGNPTLGVMLPYTPVHHLLMEAVGGPVIATSGNRAGEPVCTDESEALERLEGVADLFLLHNRPIAHRSDDSIVRIMSGSPVVLRRARGYAPLPLNAGQNSQGDNSDMPAVLALGAHMKNTVGLSVKGQIILSPHVGDLDTPQAVEGHKDAVATLCGIYGSVPGAIAHDLHPGYYSSQNVPGAYGDAPAVPVQHHYAHALSCMLDNEISAPCLAIVWDGTGYGDDGTVWGGEFLRITDCGYERFSHLHPFRLPGGDVAAREPWRVALALLHECGIDPGPYMPAVASRKQSGVIRMLDKDINCPVTTSAGRLFDGVSALLGICRVNTFEGEAAMGLEFAASSGCDEVYEYSVESGQLDWRPMIREMCADMREASVAAAKFHNTLVRAACDIAIASGEKKVILTGGCFQNRRLVETMAERLKNLGAEPFCHSRIPPNDGGIAAGQLMAASIALALRKKW